MTKELSTKRKVDKCRDTHPRQRGAGRGVRRPIAQRYEPGGGGHWPVAGGARPAPSSRLALIELGLSFDFEWGERAVLRAGKNYRCDPIPSVIGIIRYSRSSSNYAAVNLRAAEYDTRRTRPARRGVSAAKYHFFQIWSKAHVAAV